MSLSSCFSYALGSWTMLDRLLDVLNWRYEMAKKKTKTFVYNKTSFLVFSDAQHEMIFCHETVSWLLMMEQDETIQWTNYIMLSLRFNFLNTLFTKRRDE